MTTECVTWLCFADKSMDYGFIMYLLLILFLLLREIIRHH